MRIGVPTDIAKNEVRARLASASVGEPVAASRGVIVEQGAGAA